MIPLRLSEIAHALDGQLIGQDITINQVTTDSRTLLVNDLFLALKGANFDGHRFIEQVVDKGCSALIVDHQCNVNVPQIIVADTHKALGMLGAFVRSQLSLKVVGITGSSGKTTVKEMVAAILSRLGNVLATQGNFNNDIGVPLTLLRLDTAHDYAVIELGANHMGEIAYTSTLVQPDVAIINNIAAAHLEGFGDLCGVARAKGEIFEGLKTNGVAIYNKDCRYANKWQWRLVDKDVRRFSCVDESDCYSANIILNEDGCATFKLNTHVGNVYIELTVPGKHNVCNAVAAATIALEFGASLDDIRLGLAEMAPVKGRLNLHHLPNNIKLIDDTYNANVESIKAATELLASYPGRRILIIGDMGELGANARTYHQEVGEHAATCKVDDLLTLGVLSQSTSDGYNQKSGKKAYHFSERTPLMTQLKSLLTDEEQQVSILVKGSRSAHMEYVVNDIIQWCENPVTEEKV
ncbi:UDP-N-acetylmuramoyl-tripeptide--D-alanyl-D-alanine ligase [Thalassotalea piscium]|uniref:UDP-N-acetylmuramoyl-tripeptide--D-alanyl-D-alanine ligase n=1 Tax=Thalassotalea piscium TaxID=1230533 RepID=A0A7X0NE32_9GAMM|nr:UDP-N-acetylmuramoyl-tripeptide--D-alanyl-D-alanine ligase [Thalassotalea piscium]MBB6541750.1 UDP-N-acetylmuramoyl-tripeptide--D-alanyl-D-alanine ligase [Thalassotalea piscium]